jgi:hypothetical protein
MKRMTTFDGPPPKAIKTQPRWAILSPAEKAEHARIVSTRDESLINDVYGIASHPERDIDDPIYEDEYKEEMENLRRCFPKLSRSRATANLMKHIAERYPDGYVLDCFAVMHDPFKQGFDVPVFTCWTPYHYCGRFMEIDWKRGMNHGYSRSLSHPEIEYGGFKEDDGFNYFVAQHRFVDHIFYAVRMRSIPSEGTREWQAYKESLNCPDYLPRVRALVELLNLPDKIGYCPINE